MRLKCLRADATSTVYVEVCVGMMLLGLKCEKEDLGVSCNS